MYVWKGRAFHPYTRTSAAIIYQKQLLYDAALVHLVHVGLIAAFAFDMQNYAQFINAAMRALPIAKTFVALGEPSFPLLLLGHFPLTQIQNIVFRHLRKTRQWNRNWNCHRKCILGVGLLDFNWKLRIRPVARGKHLVRLAVICRKSDYGDFKYSISPFVKVYSGIHSNNFFTVIELKRYRTNCEPLISYNLINEY